MSAAIVVHRHVRPGKSTAIRALEDSGFFCIDNLPVPLVPKLMELLASRPDIDRTALVVDVREGDFLAACARSSREVRRAGHSVEVLFLDASDDILIRRFSETRRRHPLSDTDIRAGISARARGAGALRELADELIDSSALNVHELRGMVQARYSRGEGELAVTLMSFGFRHGVPPQADMVLDVRFLPNPYFVPRPVRAVGRGRGRGAVRPRRPETKAFLDDAVRLVQRSVQGFRREGKSYATVAIGCTGGRHRSVAIAKELGRQLGASFSISIRHRDIAI